MNGLLSSINGASGAVLAAVLNNFWLALGVVALVWLALKVFKRINAATRYAIWWAVLGVVLVLPLAPRLRHSREPARVTAATRASSPAATLLPPVVEPVFVTVAQERVGTWPLWAFSVWAAILLFRFTQIARSYIFLRGVKRRATVSPRVLPDCAVRRPVRLLLSSEISSPMAVGFLKPAVMLPESLIEELADPELDHVLLHELAHIARRDDWTNLAGRLAGAALALHPVAIWILRQIEREREMACDDFVVAQTGAARPYAKSLARLFELRWARRGELLASGIFGRGSRLGDRIEMLLRRGREFSPRASLARVAMSGVVLLGFVIAGSIAPRWIVFAQEAARPAFEVASIKRNVSGDPGYRYGMGPHTHVESATFKDLVSLAYDVKDFQVSGGPGWINSDRYDIDATAEGAPTPGQEGMNLPRRRLQTLLQDRFKLALRRETKELPIYELTVARGGLKLQPLKDGSCVPFDVDKFRAPGSNPMNFCGYGGFGRGFYEAASASMADLAKSFSMVVGRIVADKTGITGVFRVHLTFVPDESAPPWLLGPPGDPGNPAPAADAGPSIFTAVQEQLGLKLESSKGPVDVLVIDHVEKPDAN
jgi:bla regulator protein BlaR1